MTAPPPTAPEMAPSDSVAIDVRIHRGAELDHTSFNDLQRLFPDERGALSGDLRWLRVLQRGFGHEPFLLEARQAGTTTGLLPLAFVRSRLFGRYLVGLPYLNSGGVRATSPQVAGELISRAVKLADELDVKHLELRHEAPREHPAWNGQLTSKVHMRLQLPETSDALLASFKAKVRNQVRKGLKQGFEVHWGGHEVLDDFYNVFSRNMRDLGTPVFGRILFESILDEFPGDAELCVLRLEGTPVAGALLLHGTRTTEVPSASSLREYNATNANMAMYWHLLQRAVQRGNRCFDFGRSSLDSNTYRFKKQWGAEPFPAVWQYYVRRGEIGDVRPESGRYQQAIRVWKRLPLGLTRFLGPVIVRGIP